MAMTVSNVANSGLRVSGFLPNDSTKQSAAQKSVPNLLGASSSAQNNATANAAALQEVRTNAAALVSSYDDAKTAFYNEFDANMQNLSDSAKAVKEFDFKSVTQAFSAASKVVEAATEAAESTEAAAGEAQNVSSNAENVNKEAFSAAAKVVEAATEVKEKAEAGESTSTSSANSQNVRFIETDFGIKIVQEESSADRVVNADGSVTTTNANGDKVTSIGNGAITRTETYDSTGNKRIETAYSKVVQSALKTIQDFVDNYNESIEFFQDNSSVSARVGRMAEVFGDTTYRAQTYQSIGINVNDDGTLAVDQEKLAEAIVYDPEKVANVVGSTGLADKAESHIDVANSQRDQLFPSAQSMFGQELSTASFYTSGAYLSTNAFSNLGNLVNMMF